MSEFRFLFSVLFYSQIYFAISLLCIINRFLFIFLISFSCEFRFLFSVLCHSQIYFAISLLCIINRFLFIFLISFSCKFRFRFLAYNSCKFEFLFCYLYHFSSLSFSLPHVTDGFSFSYKEKNDLAVVLFLLNKV